MPRKPQVYQELDKLESASLRELIPKTATTQEEMLSDWKKLYERGKPKQDLNLLKIRTYMWAAQKAVSWTDALTASRGARVEVYRWITSQYRDVSAAKGGGYGKFRIDWKKLRLCIDLQTRLMVEQVCYDLGMPWRQVCTGFRPMH